MKRLLLSVLLIIIIGATMSLHDIDKGTSSRITPILNSADDVQQRMAQGTTSIQNTNDDEETDGLQFKERQVLAVQDGVNKAIMGFYGDANKFGLKVAEDGVDVLTAADDELLFNSEQNTFKIVQTGTATLSIPASWTYTGTANSLTIRHGLGYTPTFQAYVTIPSDCAYGFSWQANTLTNVPTSLLGLTSGFAETIVYIQVTADSTNLYLQAINTSGVTISNLTSVGFAFRYYILQETAN